MDLDATRTAVASIVSRVQERSADGIAAAIGSMIGRGDLPSGARLPTIRSLASELGVSTSTVSEAWRTLQHHGAVSTDRRRGTTVRDQQLPDGPRYWRVPVAAGTIELDLSTGTPDPALLPPLGPVLGRIHADVAVSSYIERPVIAELDQVVRDRLPFPPPDLTLVDGALDALDRIVAAIVSFGDVVLLEDPTFPPLIDILESAGARIVAIPIDADGPIVEAIESALGSPTTPRAFFTQPRSHNPTGGHTSAARAAAIAELVGDSEMIVVEDDHSGDASAAAVESIGSFLPEQVLHIHSFSKSHGPDLRIAAIAGPAATIEQIVRRRRLGPSWTSRLLQQILLSMLLDPSTRESVEGAAGEYVQRRRRLVDALATHGVEIEVGTGLNAWIPVADEQRAVVSLAANGVGVAPGRPFRVVHDERQHIRLSVGMLRDADTDRVAELVARAARADTPRALA